MNLSLRQLPNKNLLYIIRYVNTRVRDSLHTYAGVCQHVGEHAGLPLAVVVSFAVSVGESGGGRGGRGGALNGAVDPAVGTLEVLSQHRADSGLTPAERALVLRR